MRRIRRLLDLDADPAAIDDRARRRRRARAAGRVATPACACPAASTRSRPRCGPSSASRSPSPGHAPSPVAIVAAAGAPLAVDGGPVTHVFPTPDALAALDPGDAADAPQSRPHDRRARRPRGRRRARPRPWRRPGDVAAGAARRARHRAMDRRLRADARPRRSRRVPADGPRRARRARRRRRRPPSTPTRWRPWRSYAVHHLWSVGMTRQRCARTHHRHADRRAHARRLAERAARGAGSRTRPPGADGSDDPSHHVLVAAAAPARRVLRRHAPAVRPPARPAGHAVPARRVARPVDHPVRRDRQLRRAGGRIGPPGKARAIGAANGRTRCPIVVPCHRVIGSDGTLVGFGGGLETKAWLLHHERQVLGLELPAV